MKLKLTIFLTAFLMISAGHVFAQKPEPKPAAKAPEAKPSPAVKLPTVKEILDKYLQAVGGREANEKIQTRSMKGTVELAPMGIKGTAEVFQSAPDKNYSKITLNGIGEIIEAYDGKVAWTINPIQGNRDKTGDELLQTKIAANFHRETNFEKLYPKMEVKGIEKIGDKEAYAVIATPAGLEPQTLYFDRQSGLLLREDATMVSPEGKIPVKSFYEDYREIDGVKIPYKVRAVLPQFEITTIVTEVKNSVKIDENLFSKPKP
jgi:hypothetical protein